MNNAPWLLKRVPPALVMVLIAAGLVVLPLPAAAEPSTTYRESSHVFRPVAATRLLDTRSGIGAPTKPLAGKGRIDLKVTGRGGLPATGIGAVMINVTATGAPRGGSLTAYRTGTRRPAATLSYPSRATVANTTLVEPDPNGTISIYATTSTHVVVSVLGWFPTGSDVNALAATRLLDTRSGIGAPTKPLAGKGRIDLKVTGRGGLPATGIGAVMINVTATGAPRGGSLTAYRTGTRRPAATLSYPSRATVANTTLVEPDPNGTISIYATTSTHVVVSVLGWFPTGSDVNALAATRLLDTRSGIGAPTKPLAGKGRIDLKVTGRGGLPATGIGAVMINVTATGAPRGGSLTAYRTGTRRPAATISYPSRATVANTTLVEPDPNGTISIYATTQVDVSVAVIGFSNAALKVELETPATTTVLSRANVASVDAPAEPGQSGSVTMSSTPPPVGEIVYVPPAQDGALAGTVGRVIGVRRAGDMDVLDIVGVRLDEAFTSGTINGVSSSVESFSASGQAGARRTDKDRRSTQALPPTCQKGKPIEVEANLTPEVRVEADLSWGPGKRTHVRVVGIAEVTANFHIALTGKIECTWQPFPTMHLPPVGVVKPELAFQIKLSGQAQLGIERTTIKAKAQIRTGIDWWYGEDPQWIKTGTISGGLDAPAVKKEAKISLEVGAALKAKLAGLAGLEVFAGPFVEVVFDPSQVSWWRLDGGIKVRGAFVIEAFIVEVRYELAAAVLLRINLARAPLPITITPPADMWIQDAVTAGGTRVHWHGNRDCEFLDVLGVRTEGPTSSIASMTTTWATPSGVLDTDKGRPQSNQKKGWDFFDRTGVTIGKAGYLGTWTLKLRAFDKAGVVIGSVDVPLEVRDRNRAIQPVGLALSSPVTSNANSIPYRVKVWDPDRLVEEIVVSSGRARDIVNARDRAATAWREGDLLIAEGRVSRNYDGRCTYLSVDGYDAYTSIYFDRGPRGFPLGSKTCRS